MDKFTNIKVTEPIRDFRALARMALKGLWGKAFLGVLIYELLMAGIPRLIDVLFPSLTYTYEMEAYEGMFYKVGFSPVSFIYQFLLAGPIVIGFTKFILRIVRRKEAVHTTIFDGFQNFGKAFLLRLLTGLFVMLWTLPGTLVYTLLAAFAPTLALAGMIGLIILVVWVYLRYSMASFYMADDWSLSPMECINLSKKTMEGNTGKLFLLMLSFIGWALLASIPSSSAVQLLATVNPFLSLLISLVLSIPVYFVSLYMTTAQAFFYEIASGHLKRQEPTYQSPINQSYNNQEPFI